MKFLLIAFAIVGVATAAQLPDSATQGPNPQDIATPEPEYIDIDLPEPPRPVAVAPAQVFPMPIQARSSFSLPAPRTVQRPIAAYLPPQRSFHQQQQQQLPGHSFSGQSGYQYRRPVVLRRVYRRRY